jgi:hypothetical protein
VQATGPLKCLDTGPEVQVVGIRQQNVETELFDVPLRQGTHCTLRRYRHEYRSPYCSARCGDLPGTRAGMRVMRGHFKFHGGIQRFLFLMSNRFPPVDSRSGRITCHDMAAIIKFNNNMNKKLIFCIFKQTEQVCLAGFCVLSRVHNLKNQRHSLLIESFNGIRAHRTECYNWVRDNKKLVQKKIDR